MASDKPVASAAEALYMCKLPRTQFKIISKKKKLLTVVRSSLGAVMEAEGYGRGKKNAGEGKGKLSLNIFGQNLVQQPLKRKENGG